jgi:hypothetical protein
MTIPQRELSKEELDKLISDAEKAVVIYQESMAEITDPLSRAIIEPHMRSAQCMLDMGLMLRQLESRLAEREKEVDWVDVKLKQVADIEDIPERSRLVNRLGKMLVMVARAQQYPSLTRQLSDKSQECERQRVTLQRWTSVREENHWEDWVARWIQLFESKEQADDVYYSARSDVETHYQEGVRLLEISEQERSRLTAEVERLNEQLKREAAMVKLNAESFQNQTHLLRTQLEEAMELARCWKVVGKMVPDPMSYVIDAGNEIASVLLAQSHSTLDTKGEK